jgi:hypothetical protein
VKTFAVAVAIAISAISGQVPKTHMALEARLFLESLSAEQRKASALPLDSAARTDWHYVPKQRLGVAWGGLNAVQKQAGHALLKASLSKAGYEKIEAIRSLESVLREIEGGNPGRDTDDYHFTFFGEPSDDKPWAWRYEGHHLSLTFAFRDGKMAASSPQFLGSNPAEVQSGPKKGVRVLAKEQDLAFKLMETFTAAQLAKARIGNEAPGDIVTGNDRRAAIEDHRGLPYKEMTAPQQKALLDLLQAHAEVQSEKEQARRLKLVRSEELDELVFAWMGPVEKRSRHYYRIQGQNLLVEYDNTQSDGNHIHTVWRNLKEDFGQDPLKEHYEHGHRHR